MVSLPEEQPEIVSKMLDYLYKGNYDDQTLYTSIPSKTPVLPESPREGSPSKKRKLSELDGSSETTLSDDSDEEDEPRPWISYCPFTVNTMVYILADKYDVPQLRNLAMQKFKSRCGPTDDWEDFIQSLRILFERTRNSDRDLNNIAYEKTSRSLSCLLLCPEFSELLDDYGQLARGIMQYHVYAEQWFQIRCYICEMDELKCPTVLRKVRRHTTSVISTARTLLSQKKMEG